MSDSGDERQKQGKRRGNGDEKELASQQIQILSKRFYIDVKENHYGRFIKLAEVGLGGRRSRIMMSMSAAAELKKRLVEFSIIHAETESNSPKKREKIEEKNEQDGGTIKSEIIVKDRKRYYLDLKENQRGRFLRISMVTRGPRAFLAIPAQGITEFKDHLGDMIDRYGNADVDSDNNQNSNSANLVNDFPESKSFRAENKTFYFDCGSNQRGNFLKVSEVRQNRYRTSITIPGKSLEQFRDHLNDFLNKILCSTSNNPDNSGQNESNVLVESNINNPRTDSRLN